MPPAGSGIANYNNDVVIGPLRSGYAATPLSNRLQSGSGYYGNMELSGNVWEYCVNIFDLQGRNYTGTNGDGNLTTAPTAGFANTTNWPSTQATSVGFTFKGAAYNSGVNDLRVSDRNHYNPGATSRQPYFGGRGFR